jgi:hypothetical protein
MFIRSIGSDIKGIDEQRPHLPALEEHHAGVDRRHAQPHRDHQQGFEHVLRAQIDQQEAEQHQEDAPEHDLRLGRDQSGDTLEQVEKMNAFHTLQSSRQASMRHSPAHRIADGRSSLPPVIAWSQAMVTSA